MYHHFGRNVDSGGSCKVGSRGDMGTLYFILSFAMNLKLLLKSLFLFPKNTYKTSKTKLKKYELFY